MKKVTEFLPKDHVSPRFSVKQYKKQVEGQINDPCLAQFWVKRHAAVPSGPDAEERDSSVMGDWTEDEGTVDLQVEQEESGREGREKGEKVERGEAAGGRVSLMDHYRGFGLHRMDVGISTWYVCMFFSSFAMPCTFVSLIFLYYSSFCSCFRSSTQTFSLSRENACIA